MAREEFLQAEGYSVLLGNLGYAHYSRRPDSGEAEALERIYNLLQSLHPNQLGINEDNRREVFNAPAQARELAKSVALICEENKLELQSDGTSKLVTIPTGLYPEEAFDEQERVYAGFTGFLVGEDLLLTTDHGIPDIAKLRVVFDYQFDEQGGLKMTFSPGEIFTVQREDSGPGQNDWLLLRLSASPQRPYMTTIRRDLAPLGTKLWMLGHPLGLPMKFVDGATIKTAGAAAFRCDLDASDGNSGSLVCEDGSTSVVGVLKKASRALGPKEIPVAALLPPGAVKLQAWEWCPLGANCGTDVTSGAAFAPAVDKALVA